jgi:hypothetical protein
VNLNKEQSCKNMGNQKNVETSEQDMTIKKEQRLSRRNKSNLNKEQSCKTMGNKKCRNFGTRHDYK